MLTSYKGKTITYDAIGNPLDDGTWEYTWERGRQLKSMESVSSEWEFTYDANGQRLTKSNGTLTYHYIYNDMQLMYMKVKNGSTVVCEMYFQYGQLGLMAIQYISSSLTDGLRRKYVTPLVLSYGYNPRSPNQTLQLTGGKAMPYAFVAIAWVNTINSAFSNDPESRAKSRGYVLK